MSNDTHLTGFLEQLCKLIEAKNLPAALVLCTENTSIICNNSDEILSYLLTYDQIKLFNPVDNVSNEYKIILANVMSVCDNEDVLLILHNELLNVVNDFHFSYLLSLLETHMATFTTNKVKYYVWIFHAACNYFKKSISKYIIDDKFNYLNFDEDSVFEVILTFFVKTSTTCNSHALRRVICKSMLDVLGKPLIYLNVEETNEGIETTKGHVLKTKSVNFVKELIIRICCLQNPYVYLESNFRELATDDIFVGNLSLCHYYYLCFNKLYGYDFVPKICPTTYIFENILYFITEILTQESDSIVFKGLELVKTCLNAIQSRSQEYTVLQNQHQAKLFFVMYQTIALNESKKIRQYALKIFQQYLQTFDTFGTYFIIKEMALRTVHAAFQGYLVTEFKSLIVQNFGSNIISNNNLLNKLKSMFNVIYFNREIESVNIVEHADFIIPCLNLILYLVIRDRDNCTNIWNYIVLFQRIYLKPLTHHVNVSKSEYLRVIRESVNQTRNVTNDELNEKVDYSKMCITTLELVESLISRINYKSNEIKNCNHM